LVEEENPSLTAITLLALTILGAANVGTEEPPRHRNPPAGDGGPNHWECWLRDPDGCTVVLASPDGSAG
jgi:hypothetical protein